jgi:hypothetical protein
MPQVNLFRLIAVKTIGNHFSRFLKNRRPLFTGKPAPHPPLKLRHYHLIPVSLVLNQLMIHFGE